MSAPGSTLRSLPRELYRNERIMGVDETARRRLHSSMARVHGEGEADTLMEHLPPGGWTTVATKDDLRQLEERLETRLEAKMLKTALAVNVPSIMAAVGLAFAATRLG